MAESITITFNDKKKAVKRKPSAPASSVNKVEYEKAKNLKSAKKVPESLGQRINRVANSPVANALRSGSNFLSQSANEVYKGYDRKAGFTGFSMHMKKKKKGPAPGFVNFRF